MLVNSFKTTTPQINPLSTVAVPDRSGTPTATPWSIELGVVTTDLPKATNTPIPTQTPWIVTVTPTVTPVVDWYLYVYVPPVSGIAEPPGRKQDSKTFAKISYYWPPYAYEDPRYEINCDKVNGVLECEHMSNGEKVADFVGEAVACPREYPFGTIFEIYGGYYTCRDRGGAIIRQSENLIWLDILYPHMPDGKAWGAETEVKIWLP